MIQYLTLVTYNDILDTYMHSAPELRTENGPEIIIAEEVNIVSVRWLVMCE